MSTAILYLSTVLLFSFIFFSFPLQVVLIIRTYTTIAGAVGWEKREGLDGAVDDFYKTTFNTITLFVCTPFYIEYDGVTLSQ